jgi:hypothetical protein
MLPPEIAWRNEHLVLSREIQTPSDRARFFGRVRRGEFIQLYRGVYVGAEHWDGADRDARYRLRVLAAVVHAGDSVVSHDSAAAMWRLPRKGGWPHRVHMLSGDSGPAHPTSMLVRHPLPAPDPALRIDGIAVTSLLRTAVDVAATLEFGPAVVMVDAALRRQEHPVIGLPEGVVTRRSLREAVDAMPLRHGSARARRVIEFADGLADRPGESISRVSMHLAGVAAPQLQVPLLGASGRRYVVDFWWPKHAHIGEFDGRYKYSDPEFLRGRTPQQALFDEKLREDDLRAAGFGMSRWPWEVAVSPERMSSLLAAAGIR